MDEHVFDSTAGAVLSLVERAPLPGDESSSPATWGAEAAAWLVVAERATAMAVACLGAFDGAGGPAIEGHASTASWVTASAPLTRPAAQRLVGAARVARQHAATGKALTAGDITVVHLTTIASAIRPPGSAALYERDERVILDTARALPPDAFARAMRHWANLAADELGTGEPDQAHDRRRFALSVLPDGSSVPRGHFDPMTTAVLAAALDHVMGDPDPVDAGGPPPRSSGQRRCDALAELAREHLSGANTRAGAPVATVDVVVDLDVLHGAVVSDLSEVRCDVLGVGPVPPSVIRQLLCDSWVGRVVIRGRSEVLDLGRRTRTFSVAQRRALVARDGLTCSHPGCDRPADWCDAHHEHPWEAGGPTELSNGRLLCRWHHSWHHRTRGGPAP